MNIGDKVHYIPFKKCVKSQYENGVIKAYHETRLDCVFVVFKCGEDWENYQDYTAALTNIKQLRKGWI